MSSLLESVYLFISSRFRKLDKNIKKRFGFTDKEKEDEYGWTDLDRLNLIRVCQSHREWDQRIIAMRRAYRDINSQPRFLTENCCREELERLLSLPTPSLSEKSKMEKWAEHFIFKDGKQSEEEEEDEEEEEENHEITFNNNYLPANCTTKISRHNQLK
ncbi:unnamed protein product [Caenorhabditis sp. 36 PRJEB53466]|nr:unnamed protein product [Caenorhabditis sp. 36 PRJEB53466]